MNGLGFFGVKISRKNKATARKETMLNKFGNMLLTGPGKN